MTESLVHSLFDVRPVMAGQPAATAPAGARPRIGRSSREAFRVCVLGSGSGGNSTVVRFAGRVLLIDLGFGPRTTERRLAQVGLTLDDVHAVCLTHLDQDHFRRSWPRHLAARRIPIHLHRWHLPELSVMPRADELDGPCARFPLGLVRPLDDAPFHPFDDMPELVARIVRCQHDRQGTTAYRFDGPCGSMGYATDLGHVTPALVEHFAGVDLLAIESNYDERMTIHSARPTFVNRRNMSDSGHLSNDQAFEAVGRIAAASPHGNPRHVLLLHRSSQCNHPTKLRRVFERDPALARRVVLAEQRRRTRWVPVRPLRRVQRTQLPLIF
ncbi:MAG: MBL fold metallo-hydrolase [Phycisphaeraceae bacterium]